MMNIDINELYLDYLSGQIFENLENVGIDVYDEVYDEFSLINQLYEHKLFRIAEEKCKKNNESLEIEFYFNDVFVNCDLKNYDILQELVDTAYSEVKTKEYFLENVLSKVDEEIAKVLLMIY